MLSGIKVIDVTTHLAGPYCTWVLGELGADVIKIERPGGDPARTIGPFVHGVSLYFESVNRTKRSVELDLKTPFGREVLGRLLESADVLIENLRPGALARMGFSAERIADLNPRLVYASISGFGQDGPFATRSAFDIVVQAMSGMMSITGPDGGPGVRVGMSIGDIAAGLFAAIDILAAITERERTGSVRRVDIAMLECQLALMENAVARTLNTDEVPQPLGTRHPTIAPFQTFVTSDGSVAVAADGDEAWRRLCEALDLPHLVDDPRFAREVDRVVNYAQLDCILSPLFRARSNAEWLELLRTADVASGPVNDLPTSLASPQIAARQAIIKSRGLSFVAPPVGDRPRGATKGAPALGADTAQIVKELGLSEVAQAGEPHKSRPQRGAMRGNE